MSVREVIAIAIANEDSHHTPMKHEWRAADSILAALKEAGFVVVPMVPAERSPQLKKLLRALQIGLPTAHRRFR